MSKLIDDKLCQYFHPKKVEEAFLRYKEAKHDVFTEEIRIPMGADGISSKTFEKELSRRCQFISKRVIHGTYLFYPFREVNIPKPSGQERVLAIATIRDVLVQKILYELLYEEVEKLFKATPKLDRVSCAYRKGKSASSAARLIHNYIQSGFHFSLDADIVKFFDVIAHDRLISIIQNLFGHETRVSTLLRRFIKTSGIPYRDEQNEPRVRASQSGLTQGFENKHHVLVAHGCPFPFLS
ncbi:reverse transcriptase domain-containing protein [Laspinema sp. D1]|uniref:reverse transcriptase domain-containing protein n=1 Tax=Laspinema palackyanum TaxID=3231601 RepID=UPI00349687B4|nr:reverse transcriptase domain-containing protein [Laspinema sp. D2b]